MYCFKTLPVSADIFILTLGQGKDDVYPTDDVRGGKQGDPGT